jgi:putative pyruvate formate lyase activating enzyme
MDSRLQQKVENLLKRLEDCDLCPRNCHVDRISGCTGICGQTARVKVSSANLHFGEEPPISGRRGSGTIFLTGCNLRCVYCQNYPISQMQNGAEVSPLTLVDYMLELEKRGAHNINFVTPTHFTAQIAEAIVSARRKGLAAPIVWNSSGYEKAEVLAELAGLVEIYMPDMRYGEPGPAGCYSAAEDYPQINRGAIAEMHRQVGDLRIDSEGVAVSGLLIRHLVLPENIAGSEEVFKFISEKISRATYISLMSQYFPAYRAYDFKELSRRITRKEYLIAKRLMEKYNLTNGWMQNEILS